MKKYLFFAPKTPLRYRKRVVGLPGDVLEMRGNQLYRNGDAVRESRVMNVDPQTIAGRDTIPPVTVPARILFVSGDNRNGDSGDWRFHGCVAVQAVQGRFAGVYRRRRGVDFSTQGGKPPRER